MKMRMMEEQTQKDIKDQDKTIFEKTLKEWTRMRSLG